MDRAGDDRAGQGRVGQGMTGHAGPRSCPCGKGSYAELTCDQVAPRCG